MKGQDERIEVMMVVSVEGGVEKRRGVMRIMVEPGRWTEVVFTQEQMMNVSAAMQQISDRMLQMDPLMIPVAQPAEMRIH